MTDQQLYHLIQTFFNEKNVCTSELHKGRFNKIWTTCVCQEDLEEAEAEKTVYVSLVSHHDRLFVSLI